MLAGPTAVTTGPTTVRQQGLGALEGLAGPGMLPLFRLPTHLPTHPPAHCRLHLLQRAGDPVRRVILRCYGLLL